MPALPDLEALAIFAKVAELRSFAGVAQDLELSKATVSKAVSRLEVRLGTRLFYRTSRRLALTDAGRLLVGRAQQVLAEGEAAENEALAQSTAPRGTVRLAVPMSFGLLKVAPLLPDFLTAYPEITLDIDLSDRIVDLVGEGFDAALRIAALPDSSLIVQKLCGVETLLVASPKYLAQHGHPQHPQELENHLCFAYSYLQGPGTWRFTNASGEIATVKPRGALRANNGDALLPSVEAGFGIARLPDFIVRDGLARRRLEIVMPEWRSAPGALHFVTPQGGPRPPRVDVLARFFFAHLSERSAKSS